MKKFLLFISITSLASIINLVGTSASAYERIINFNSLVTITKDNVAKITESIEYDFDYSYHHGIYRDIPVDYQDGADKYYLNFRLISVTNEFGSRQETEVSSESGNKRIRIGDPDKTIAGVHTYKISYELSPIITLLNNKPFLNLDIVGEGWTVPIDKLTANIILEDGSSLTNINWYGGVSEPVNVAEIQLEDIRAYEGITINANLPDGYVSEYLQPNKQRLSDIIGNILSAGFALIIFIVIVGSIIIAIARAAKNKRMRNNQTVVPEYEPPKNLSPAHIGLLEDDKAEGREITAAIINWAVQGYLKIEYIPKKNIFSKKDYKLLIVKDTSALPKIELDLLLAIFSTAKEINLSKINKITAASGVAKFKKELTNELTQLGYYDSNGQIFMRGTLTESGAKQWAKVDGFKLYLSVAEKDRLKFFNAPEKTPEKFSEYLPYAIALGVEKEWAKQFKNIDLSETTDWYVGNYATFSAIAIASDIGKSFAPTVSSNSSYSSSGGVGGGGFGGGGGGSW